MLEQQKEQTKLLADLAATNKAIAEIIKKPQIMCF